MGFPSGKQPTGLFFAPLPAFWEHKNFAHCRWTIRRGVAPLNPLPPFIKRWTKISLREKATANFKKSPREGTFTNLVSYKFRKVSPMKKKPAFYRITVGSRFSAAVRLRNVYDSAAGVGSIPAGVWSLAEAGILLGLITVIIWRKMTPKTAPPSYRQSRGNNAAGDTGRIGAGRGHVLHHGLGAKCLWES